MPLDSNLGIWENKSCVQCGACCYDYNNYQLCRNQEIRDGKSYCGIHDNSEREKLCQVWFCNSLGDKSISAIPTHIQDSIKQRLIAIAKGLGTTPSTSSVPQQNR